MGKWLIEKHKGKWWIFQPGEHLPVVSLPDFTTVLAYCNKPPVGHKAEDRHGVACCSCGYTPKASLSGTYNHTAAEKLVGMHVGLIEILKSKEVKHAD